MCALILVEVRARWSGRGRAEWSARGRVEGDGRASTLISVHVSSWAWVGLSGLPTSNPFQVIRGGVSCLFVTPRAAWAACYLPSGENRSLLTCWAARASCSLLVGRREQPRRWSGVSCPVSVHRWSQIGSWVGRSDILVDVAARSLSAWRWRGRVRHRCMLAHIVCFPTGVLPRVVSWCTWAARRRGALKKCAAGSGSRQVARSARIALSISLCGRYHRC